MSGKHSQASAWTRGLFTAALLASLAPAAASAQEIETVIVTAQKRAENVQDVPISMTVLGGQQLAGLHVRDIKSLQDYIPNLVVARTGVNDVVYMRGFGSGVNNIAFDQDVSVYKDGVYGGKGAQFTAPFFDVERMEVVRGPQGARFGKNTAAGAISIVSAGPTDEFEAGATVAYNVIQTGPEVTGYVAGPISDTFGGRVAIKYVNQDGFLKNTATGRDDPQTEQMLGRITLVFKPSDDLDITAKYEYGNFYQRGGVNQSGSCAAVAGGQVTGCLNLPRTSHGDSRYAPDPYPPTLGLPEHNGIISNNAVVTGNLKVLNDHTLTTVIAYSQFTTKRISAYDMTMPDGVTVTPPLNGLFANGFPEAFSQYSAEVRLASPTGQTFEYIVGAYWDSADYHLHQNSWYINLNQTSVNQLGAARAILASGKMRTDYFQGAVSYSVFADATWHLTDDLRILASARYSTQTKSGNLSQGLEYGTPRNAYSLNTIAGGYCPGTQPFTSINVAGEPASFNFCVNQRASGHISEETFDPSATIQFDAMEDVMVYATYARGSKSGGMISNTYALPGQGLPFIFKPERATNYELGMKSLWDEGRIMFNIALYHMTIKDLQQSAYDPTRQTFITSNAASATSKGIEVDARWRPLDELELSTNFAYNDARFDDFPGAGCLNFQPVTVCNPAAAVGTPTHPRNNNIAGVVLPYTSMWSGNVTVHHTLGLGDLKLDTWITNILRSKYVMNDTYAVNYGIQPSTVKTDVRIQLGDVEDRWHVAVVGKNILNIKTIANSIQLPPSITSVSRSISWMDERRQVIIEGSYKF